MEPFGPATFGTLNAQDYDALHDPGTTEATVAAIAALAGAGRILELAIGTGRVALPLAALGHAVAGIEGSAEMVAKLREKPGGAAIDVRIGDFADVDIDGVFDHVFLVYNTLFNLQTQADQVRCFANVAARLAPGGSFLIETFVPDLSGFHDGQRVRALRVAQDSTWLEAAHHDPVAQIFDFQRLRFTAAGLRMVPLRMRYAWPAEIDLMAQMAGLQLAHRWGGWDKRPFDAHSRMHVSVYRNGPVA
ncbi:MAG: class I SAM-dependent methyltransferase [Pseudomonadota bacterium]